MPFSQILTIFILGIAREALISRLLRLVARYNDLQSNEDANKKGSIMISELIQNYRLRWNDYDRFGRIVPNSVLDLFQSLAIIQAEEMGIGRDRLLEQGLVWVLVRMKYEVLHQPAQEDVEVRTWPHDPSKFSFLRDFTIHDSQGLAIKATSEWVLMDMKARKFARFDESLITEGAEYSPDRSFESKPRKIAPFELPAEPLLVLKPSYNDIDINLHVNNARYPGYVMDALRLGPDQSIHTLQIDYRHEIAPDSTIAIYTHEDGQMIYANGVLEDGTVAFSCAIELA